MWSRNASVSLSSLLKPSCFTLSDAREMLLSGEWPIPTANNPTIPTVEGTAGEVVLAPLQTRTFRVNLAQTSTACGGD